MSAVSVVGPLVWWVTHGATDASFNTLVQINGIAILFTVAAVSATLMHAQKRDTRAISITAAIAFVSAFLLAAINNSGSHPNFDYQCVQNAAVNIVERKEFYGEATGYVLYPPMYAGSMHAAYKAVGAVAKLFHWHPNMLQAFNVVFYLFQNLQSLAMVGLIWLSYRFTSVCADITDAFERKNSKLFAAGISCAVVGMNWPIYGTIQWNQVNIFVTCLVLFALTFVNTRHIARGFAVAAGIHLKAYPGLLIPAFLLSKDWKAAAYATVFTAVLAALTTAQFGVGVWQTYFHTAHEFINKIMMNPPTYMVDGSNLWSLVFCTGKTFGTIFGTRQLFNVAATGQIATALKLCICLFFAWRLISRQRAQRSAKAVSKTYLLFDNACDFLSVGLLVGPTTLNHHYVLAIPVMLWTIVRSGLRAPFLVFVGCVMMSNFQSHLASLMTLAPIGLLLLASARSTKPAAAATVESDNASNRAMEPLGAEREPHPVA